MNGVYWIFDPLNRVRFKTVIWILCVTETLHNIEEALWLPDAVQSIEIPILTGGAFEFRFAIILLTLMFYGIIAWFLLKDSKLSSYLLGGITVMILFNVFIPHLIGSIITLKYIPGTISGVLLNLPAGMYLLRRGMREGYFNLASLITSGIAFTLCVSLLLPLSFRIGSIMQQIIS